MGHLKLRAALQRKLLPKGNVAQRLEDLEKGIDFLLNKSCVKLSPVYLFLEQNIKLEWTEYLAICLTKL